MKWIAGLIMLSVVGEARQLTGHTVLLQPIVLCDDEGKSAAKANLSEALIDLPFRRWDVDFQILEPIRWSRREFRDGESDVNVIVKKATEEGVFRHPRRIANMVFAKKINGRPAPNGLGQQPGWVTFIAQAGNSPLGQDAFVVIHEVSHNLGLAHSVDDNEVPNDVPNVMGDGDFMDRIREDGITRNQAATILKSPLVRETVRCLNGDEARKAYLDENFEFYYGRLNRREVEAMTGKIMPKELDGAGVKAEARKRYEAAVVDFSKEEREVLLWMVGEFRKVLVGEFPLLANQPWELLKVKGDHCAGFPHTRGLSVVLSEKAVDRMMGKFKMHGKTKLALEGGSTILVHEQFHVLQRCYPEKFARLYTEIYGLLDGVVAENHWVAANEISNPDGLDGNRWVIPHEGQFYWMKTMLKIEDEPARMPQSFREGVFPLDKRGKEYVTQSGGEGKPPKQVSGEVILKWKEQFPIRVGHDHPNEISAYLFQAELGRLLKGMKPSEDEMTRKTMAWCRKELR